MAGVLIQDIDYFNIDSNTELCIFDQSSSKEIELLNALYSNQTPISLNSNFKSFAKNVSLLLLIDQYSCLM